MRTSEQFLSEIDAILARYIAGGYEPYSGEPIIGKAPSANIVIGPDVTNAEITSAIKDAVGSIDPNANKGVISLSQCPGCRVTLDNKLICPCNPELEAGDGNN